MINNLKESLKILESSKEFKTWQKDDQKAFLSNCFAIIENPRVGVVNWEIDYYSPKKDKITSFLVNKNKITVKEDQDILRQKNYNIEELDISKVKIKLNDAIKKIKKKYSDETPEKIIIILQKLDITNWNITFITQRFNILNVKIDSESGKIISEDLKPVISFQSKNP